MKSLLFLLAPLFLLVGCATHSEEQIAAVRAAGVSPNTVYRLQHDRIIYPEDIIELRRKRVSDEVPIRHLQEVGVDYVPQRTDLRRMRAADVRPVVIDEVILAGQRFVSDRYDRSNFSWGLSLPLFSWYPYGYGYGWGYGGYGGYYRNYHHGHHGHHGGGHHGHSGHGHHRH